MSGPQGSLEPAHRARQPIGLARRIGHVHLRTADVDRVRAFSVDLLGFDVVYEARDVPGWGTTTLASKRVKTAWIAMEPRVSNP